MKKRLLLISNSVSYKKGFLGHVSEEIIDFLGNIKTILFVPFAGFDLGDYEKISKKKFTKMGISLSSIHKEKNKNKAIKSAEAIYIGGGNTFRLLAKLQKEKLLESIKTKVNAGIPYIGSSAGANLASPTIKTTNDMPIVEPQSFKALYFINFQINPHYIDIDKNSKHLGESREMRINEFHQENSLPVLGLREDAWLRVEGKKIKLKGKNGARVFYKNKSPLELKPETNIEKYFHKG